MSVLISVPAGRCARRPGTKWVDPQPEKGMVELRFEDDLMHLYWKNRTSGVDEDDLIIFPGEATFEKVTQDSTGRTHILKFSSSDQKYFFWFQRKDTSGYARSQVDVNALLQDPSYTLGSAPIPEQSAAAEESTVVAAPTEAQATASASTTGTAEGSSTSASGSASANPQTEMARLLMQWAQTSGLPSGSGGAHEEASLTDVLSPANITSLINAHPEIVDSLAPHLPPALGLGDKPEAKDVLPILTAPQFADAIGSLDEALRSGGLPGSVMRELGLPEESGQSVSAFLEALRGLGPKDESSMDTD